MLGGGVNHLNRFVTDVIIFCLNVISFGMRNVSYVKLGRSEIK